MRFTRIATAATLAALTGSFVTAHALEKPVVRRQPAAVADAAWTNQIRASYRNAFGREPTSEELQHWLSQPPLTAVQLTERHRAHLKQNQAARREIIVRSYENVLKRAPSAENLAYWDTRVAQSGETYVDVMNVHSRSLNQGAAAGQTPSCAGKSSALYAYDGTLTRAEHRSAIWQVLARFQGMQRCTYVKRYQRGPELLGTDSDRLYLELYRLACNDVKSRKIDKVFVIGFSRGAMNAIRFANEFGSCMNGKPVYFIGVSDPVDAFMGGIYETNKSLHLRRATHSYKTSKSKNDYTPWPVENGFFATNPTPGFRKVEVMNNREQASNMANPDRHWMMNASGCYSGRDAERRLIREMTALGATFGPALPPGPEPCKM